MIENPHMLPKLRSKRIMAEAQNMPCTLRLAGFIGLRCASCDTNVMDHLDGHGNGMATKVTDLNVACACIICHGLRDNSDPRGMDIEKRYPAAYNLQLRRANQETLTRLAVAGILLVPDGQWIK